jgi:protein-disulfide isomerase
VLPLTLATVALGVVAVVAFALVSAPPAAVDLRSAAVPTDSTLAVGQALGTEGAPLTIDICSDFQCVHCATLATGVKPLLVRDYVSTGQARLVFRDFPFLGSESIDAAVAARCAARQDRFWQYHDYLFANQAGIDRRAFSDARLTAMAEAVGLDMAAFSACTADPAARQSVIQDRDAAAAVPVESTPTLVLNGERVVVGVPSYAELQAIIEAELAEAAR